MKGSKPLSRRCWIVVRAGLVAGIAALLVAPTLITASENTETCGNFFTDDFDTTKWASASPHMILPGPEGVHGLFSNECVVRTFTVAQPHESLQVNLRYFAVGSWDTGEVASVTIAGVTGFSMVRTNPFLCDALWTIVGPPGFGTQAEVTFPNTTCYKDVSFMVAHTSVNPFQLAICGSINQSVDDEWFGFSNVSIDICAQSAPAGAVPDGNAVPGVPLTVNHDVGSDIILDWGNSCSTGDTDYEIYEGTLGIYYSHTSRFCTTGGATFFTFTPAEGSTYYIVVPQNILREGSYGRDSGGAERPPSIVNCLAQEIGGCP